MRYVIFSLLSAGLLFANDPIRTTWERTPETLAGLYVQVQLADGTHLGGHWASVTEERFTMKIEESSDRQAWPRGVRNVDRASITRLRAGKRHTRGRVIGTLCGYVLSMALIETVRVGPGIVLPALVFGMGGGYAAGSAYDHYMRDVEIVPEPR
jgi:hypothetical protein